MSIDVAVAVLIVLVATLAGLVALRYRFRRETPVAVEADLEDGIVVLVDRGQIVRASRAMIDGLKVHRGLRLEELLRPLLGPRAADVLRAFEALETSGEPVHFLTRDASERPLEIVGAPEGALVKVMLRDATHADQKLRNVQAELEKHEAALSLHNWKNATLDSLLDRAPLILWNRRPGEGTNWTGGQIVTREATVTAGDAIGLLEQREQLELSPKNDLEKARLEIAGNGPITLHSVEVACDDGCRAGFAVDASQTATAERTLTRFVQTMTETFAHLTVGLAIFDRNRRLILFNPALAEMWQIDAAWLARQPDLQEILDRLRSTRRIPELSDYRGWRDQLLALFAQPEAVEYEESWDLASGSRIRVMARPHPHGALAFVFDDVTEQLKLESRYRHMDDLLRTVLDRLDEGLAVFGPNGLLQFVNSAFHEIWDTDQEAITVGLHARSLFDLCSRLTVETDVWELGTTFATGELNREVWTARLTQGSGRVLRARFAPLPGGSTLVAFADISDSERAALALVERNEALEAAEEMRRVVLDQISHRLRTPLNTVFGFSQLLTDTRFGNLNAHQQTYAAGITEAAGHLLDTVKDVTELASMELEKPVHDPDGLDVDYALKTIRNLLSSRALAARVTLNIAEGETIGRFERDGTRLRQILFNMTADAINRSRDGGKVEIGAARSSNGAITVYTRESAPTETQPGRDAVENDSPTLPLVRRLAEKEGGEIEILCGDGREQVDVLCIFPSVLAEIPDDAEEDA